MPFGFHPFFLIGILIFLVLVIAFAYAVAWVVRKGWDQAARKRAGETPTAPPRA